MQIFILPMSHKEKLALMVQLAGIISLSLTIVKEI
jgi:hypothetical protein